MGEIVSRIIVSVGGGRKHNPGCDDDGADFDAMQHRLDFFFHMWGEQTLQWTGYNLPPGSPQPKDSPYAFKLYAIDEAHKRGCDTVIWADSSIIPIRQLIPLWEYIEQRGYWFSDNMSNNNGEWTCDSALPILGLTREESFHVPQCSTNAFGLCFKHDIAQKFFHQWQELEKKGAFIGPKNNIDGEASDDPRVLGHRQDQTAASVLLHRLNMEMTKAPDFMVQGWYANEKTILVIERKDILCLNAFNASRWWLDKFGNQAIKEKS
jgi:hypothetical protein